MTLARYIKIKCMKCDTMITQNRTGLCQNCRMGKCKLCGANCNISHHMKCAKCVRIQRRSARAQKNEWDFV